MWRKSRWKKRKVYRRKELNFCLREYYRSSKMKENKRCDLIAWVVKRGSALLSAIFFLFNLFGILHIFFFEYWKIFSDWDMIVQFICYLYLFVLFSIYCLSVLTLMTLIYLFIIFIVLRPSVCCCLSRKRKDRKT